MDTQIDWDTRYRLDDTPWEKGYAAPPLKEFLERAAFKGRVLVPGCGLGHDVRLLAAHGAEPVGFDVSETALERARAFPRAGAESYCQGNFFDLCGSLSGTFDGIFEHTFFCAIEPSLRQDYVNAACKALKPDGLLLAIFFINIEDPEGPPFPVSTDEVDQLFHDSFETLEKWIPQAAYPGRAGREEMRLMRLSNHRS